jgi:hypothetical protein
VLDTFQEISNALNNDDNLYNTFNNKINLKADTSSINTINRQITDILESKNYFGSMELNSTNNTGLFIDWHAKKSNTGYDVRMSVDDASVPNTIGTSYIRISGTGLIVAGHLNVAGNIVGSTISNIVNRLTILEAPLCAGYLDGHHLDGHQILSLQLVSFMDHC